VLLPEVPIKFSFEYSVLAMGIQVKQHADQKYASQLINGAAKN